MNDYIIRAIAANDQIRAFAAVTTETVETARQDHNTSPVATAALGRLLTAGAMMGTMMKGDKDILTLQIKAGGPLEGITVTADSKGRVKGYVGNPDVCIPANSKGKLDVAGAVGVGFMNVIKDMGLKEPYVGLINRDIYILEFHRRKNTIRYPIHFQNRRHLRYLSGGL